MLQAHFRSKQLTVKNYPGQQKNKSFKTCPDPKVNPNVENELFSFHAVSFTAEWSAF